MDPQHADGYHAAAAWTTVAILFALSLYSYIDRQLISMLVGPIKHDLHLSDTQFSIAQGLAFAIFYCASGIPLGMAIDRYSRRHVIFICVVLWSLGCVSCGLANSLFGLFAARVLVGAAEAAVNPGAQSLIGDAFPTEKAGAALGIFAASIYFGYGLSLFVGGRLVTFLTAQGRMSIPLFGVLQPWQAAFLIVGLPGILLAFLVFAIHDPRPLRAGRNVISMPALGMRALWLTRGRLLLHFLTGIAAITAAFQIVVTWTPTFLMRKFALPPSEIGLWLGAGILSGGIGSIIGGLLINRLARAGFVTAPFLVAIAATLFGGPLLVIAHLLNDSTASFVVLGSGEMIFGAIAASSYGSIQVIVPPSARGKAAALVVVTTAIVAQGIAPLLVALVTDYVFRRESQIGASLAIVEAATCVIAVTAFATGLAPLRKSLDPRVAAV